MAAVILGAAITGPIALGLIICMLGRCQSPKYENGFLTLEAVGVGSGNENL